MLLGGKIHISAGIYPVGGGVYFLKFIGHQAGVLFTGTLNLEFVSLTDPTDPAYSPEYAIERHLSWISFPRRMIVIKQKMIPSLTAVFNY